MDENVVSVDLEGVRPGQVVVAFMVRREDGSLHADSRIVDDPGVLAFGSDEAEEELGWLLVAGLRSVQRGAGVDVGPVWDHVMEEEPHDGM